jgi:hypothetical protein
LTLLGGEREEWKVRGALPAREIKRLMGGKGEVDHEGEMETERDDEQKARKTFERGILVEAEFAFTRAVGNFCREAAREGMFKENYGFNLKEQMEKKAKLEQKVTLEQNSGKGEPVRVLLIGGEPNRSNQGGD